MYSNILVPVDNSRHSNRAIDTGLELGKRFGAKLVGCHVYAAKMHDYRFKQMEFTLPEEYLVEQELHRQRKIHDSLITMGLELISDCYLESMKGQCEREGVAFEGKMMDGKHSTELVRDIGESNYDLVVLGVLGIGRTRDSQVGSVCARIAQESSRDVWVVKHLPEADEPERDTVLVGVDGSPKSFGALATALELCQRFGKKLEVIAVYDPYLHYAVFKGVVEVLTEKASKVFRFEEQNQLHEEIIDTGLAAIYQSHLNVAEQMAREAGVECSKTLLDGKCFQKVLDHARKSKPWVLVVGRLGVHSAADATGLGSNTENLLRLAPCDVLLTTAEVTPELDVRAEESIHWTPEALGRMERVPPAVLGIARTAILRLALEQGHSVVSSDLVTEAMERFMPKRAAERNLKLAEALVLERAERGETVMVCTGCGIAARTAQAVKCQVCGGESFEALDPQAIARIIMEEGGAEEETTYDGRKVRWTQEAREALRAIDDRYQRRRAKARIEKAAHGGRTDVVTLELAKRFIEEETGILFAAPAPANGAAANGHAANGHAANGHAANGNGHGHTNGAAANGHDVGAHANGTNGHAAHDDATNGHADEADGPRLVARDGKGVPLVSTREWTTPAIERIVRVPAGFMRDRTQERVEALAAAAGAATIDLPLVEEGIQLGVQAMEEMIAQQAVVPAAAEVAPAAASACPFARVAANHPDALRGMFPLDEVSVVSELERQRRELGSQG
ncbi:MAG TPA: universal stress protein [Thermoanaerobaculia bacterium]|nr:universal stress protein [Thermoanaerobaculia bacterium]